MSGVEQIPPAAPPSPPKPNRWSRFMPLVLVIVAIAAVAGGRGLLRKKNASDAVALKTTGRTVAVMLEPLPEGLVQEGTFNCVELKRSDGKYTARIVGGGVKNGTTAPMPLRFDMTVASGARQESVGREFTLAGGQKVPSFTMASKTVPPGITRCTLKLTKTGAPGAVAGPTAEQVQAVRDAAKMAGCGTPVSKPDEGRDHVAAGTKVSYKTKPPTSGSHYASPGPTGVHKESIQNETQVHNLEHGHIGVQYRGVSAGTISALERIANADPQWVFVAPYNTMPSHIALTAWTVILTCGDEPQNTSALGDLVKAFVAAYKNHGPESIAGTPAR